MLGPSPDWIVGISSLELCLANCTWLEKKEIPLYPWDAGVDDGISYESPDSAVPSFRLKVTQIGTLENESRGRERQLKQRAIEKQAE